MMFAITMCKHRNAIWCKICRPEEWKKELEHRKKMKKLAKEFTKKAREAGLL